MKYENLFDEIRLKRRENVKKLRKYGENMS